MKEPNRIAERQAADMAVDVTTMNLNKKIGQDLVQTPTTKNVLIEPGFRHPSWGRRRAGSPECMAMVCALWITNWVSLSCRRGFGRILAYSGNNYTEKEGDASSDEGDNRSLHLKQGKVAEDEVISHGWAVKIAHVGCRSETSGKVHLYISFKVENDGSNCNEFVDAGHRFPVLPWCKKLTSRLREVAYG
jgi:hypothetical protein